MPTRQTTSTPIPEGELHKQRPPRRNPLGRMGTGSNADAPPHAEPEQAATTIDLSEVTEGAVQALTGIKAGGRCRVVSHTRYEN